LLQIVCNQLVLAASERDPMALKITSADLHAFGGIEGLFQLYLENAINELTPESRLLARLVLDALMTQDRTKQAMRIDDLLRQQFVATREELAAILTILSKFHIVRRDTRGSEEWFELVHEKLIPIVQRWIRADSSYLGFLTAHNYLELGSKTQVFRTNPEALLDRGHIEGVVGPYAARLRFGPQRLDFILWSCIYRNSPEVVYWAERCGRERTTEVLLAAMNSGTEVMRRGALAAISRFDCVPSRKIIETCLRLSLEDPSEAVRRMAGAELGRHGEEKDLAELRTALQRDETRGGALEVYADVLGSGRALPSIGSFAAFQARRIARRRQFQKCRKFRRRRRNLGLLYGVATGVLWSLTIIPLFFLTDVLIEGPRNDVLSNFSIAMVIVFFVTAISSPLLGWTFAVSAARHDILKRPESWLLDVAFAKVLWVIVLIYIAVVVIDFVDSNQVGQERFFWVIMPLAYGIVILPLATAIARECIGRNYRAATVIWWGGFAAAVIPAVFAAVVLCIGYYLLDASEYIDSSYDAWLLLTVVGTTIAAIALSALALPRLWLPFRPLEGHLESGGVNMR
jgi:hypothetical protein